MHTRDSTLMAGLGATLRANIMILGPACSFPFAGRSGSFASRGLPFTFEPGIPSLTGARFVVSVQEMHAASGEAKLRLIQSLFAICAQDFFNFAGNPMNDLQTDAFAIVQNLGAHGPANEGIVPLPEKRCGLFPLSLDNRNRTNRPADPGHGTITIVFHGHQDGVGWS